MPKKKITRFYHVNVIHTQTVGVWAQDPHEAVQITSAAIQIRAEGEGEKLEIGVVKLAPEAGVRGS